MVMTVEEVARVAHEVNRAYCLSIGDTSQVPWDQAPDWQRSSAKNGVRFRLQFPDAPPSASHENWLREKLAAGWKYGPVKDVEKKEHPCCVPFDGLEQAQRVKDFLFVAVVDALTDPIRPGQ